MFKLKTISAILTVLTLAIAKNSLAHTGHWDFLEGHNHWPQLFVILAFFGILAGYGLRRFYLSHLKHKKLQSIKIKKD